MVKKNKEDHFVFFSLDEDKADTLANTLGNKTSRSILKFLSSKESVTESEVSKELNLPLPTVHYNLQNLLKSNLIKVEEFHYSKKGREVNHYSISKKYIVIAPESNESILNKFKSLLSLGTLIIATSFAINLFRFMRRDVGSEFGSQIAQEEVSRSVAYESNNLMKEALDQSTNDSATNFTYNIGEITTNDSFLSFFPTWFLIGGLFVIIVIFLWMIMRKKE